MGVNKRERELAEFKANYIKKSSCILLVILALAAGAFIGNAITMLSIGQRGMNGAVPSAPTQSASMPTGSAEQLAAHEEAAEADPTNPDGWIHLGNYCFDNNFPVKAITAYKRALELAPMKVGVWSDLGVMYRRTKQFKDAVDAFSHAAQLDPKHITSRFNMGVVYLHDLNDKAGAIKAWKSVLAIDPNAKTPAGDSVAKLVQDLEQ